MRPRFGRETSLRRVLLDLFFPPRCVVCRRVDAQWYCSSCRSQMTKIVPPLCDRCGRPTHRSECPYCQKLPLQIDGIRAVAFFDGNLRRAIHGFKYQHRPELADVLSGVLSDYLEAHPLPADTLAPVPLHVERERTRGYNQALLLAETLGARIGLPVWSAALSRVRCTRTQTDLDASERHANVHGAFAADSRVAGRQVLLIDDVCTTGATLDACGVALKERGAKSVWGLALARGR